MTDPAHERAAWRERRVFLTGATGLLGGHLVERLRGLGAEVVCLVRDWVPRSRTVEEGWLDGTIQVRGELEDVGVLARAVHEHDVDTVFHLGAQALVGSAAAAPVLTFESNVRGTWNLLEACRVSGRRVRMIVIASSDKAYGDQGRRACAEDARLEGRAPYDASKAAADVVAASYAHAYALPVAIARCGNLYGPGDLHWDRLVPGTIRSVLRGEAPVIRSDGSPARDWLFVEDAVEGYLALAERQSAAAGEAFNFGTGDPRTVLDVVEAILRLAGAQSLRPRILSDARWEIPWQSLDASKARSELQWEPRTPLEEGLGRTLDWYRRRAAGRAP